MPPAIAMQSKTLQCLQRNLGSKQRTTAQQNLLPVEGSHESQTQDCMQRRPKDLPRRLSRRFPGGLPQNPSLCRKQGPLKLSGCHLLTPVLCQMQPPFHTLCNCLCAFGHVPATTLYAPHQFVCSFRAASTHRTQLCHHLSQCADAGSLQCPASHSIQPHCHMQLLSPGSFKNMNGFPGQKCSCMMKVHSLWSGCSWPVHWSHHQNTCLQCFSSFH